MDIIKHSQTLKIKNREFDEFKVNTLNPGHESLHISSIFTGCKVSKNR